MKLLKKIWKRIRSLFIKRSPSNKKVILEERAILDEVFNPNETFHEITKAEDGEKKNSLISRLAKHNTAKKIIEITEDDPKNFSAIKKGYKKAYELHDLRAQLLSLEEKSISLDYVKSKIVFAEYSESPSLENGVVALSKFLSANKNNDKIELSSFSISSFDNTLELEKLLEEKSTLRRHRIRENEKQKKEQLYRDQIRKKLSIVEIFIIQNKLQEAQPLINDLTRSIKPIYEKEITRLKTLIERYKEKELEIFRKRQAELLKKQLEEAEALRKLEEERQKELRLKKQEEALLKQIEEQKKKAKTQKLNELLNKKTNWTEFQNVLNENDITTFYHFTDASNIKSIKQNGGLYSWHYADLHGIVISYPGGDGRSRSLDKKNGLHDYVSLSLCDDHPMQYRLRTEGRKLILLEIEIEVAYFENTSFSNMNATDSRHTHGSNLEDLKRIKFSATKRNYVSREDPDFKYHQAEVLVKTWIPIKYISNINKV